MLHAPDLTLARGVAENILGGITGIERVPEGVSTWVYRIRHKGEILYLRVLPEDASFAVEVHVHEMLRELGVRVPRVIHFEERNPIVHKSVMITEELPGHTLQQENNPSILRTVLRAAGREIALVNTLSVQGFGWIDRTKPLTLSGEQPTCSAFYATDIAYGVSRLPALGVPVDLCASIGNALDVFLAGALPTEARLVHGDFDTTHIFHHKGIYSGLIDFGEIMGNHPLYDLALFDFYSDQPPESGSFDALLEGYSEITPIDRNDLFVLRHFALLFGVWKIAQQDRKAARRESFIANLVERVQRQMQMIVRA